MVSIKRNCLFIYWVLLPHVILSLSNWPRPKNDHFALANAAALIARKYISKSSSTIVIIEQSLDSNTQALNKRILEHILSNLQDTIAVQLINGDSEHHPWEYHIFVIDSSEAFEEIRWNFPKSYYERDYRFLIILSKFTTAYWKTLNRIFTSCRRFHVVNANVILNHPSLGVSMFKYNLFTKEKCHVVQPYLYFRFNESLDRLANVFPQTLLNMYGCPLRVTARVNRPFVTFSGNKSNPGYDKGWKSLSGIDGELIKLLARNLNFTINLLPFPKEQTYFKNNTGFGCFADLLDGKADIALGGFSASNPKRFILTPSDVYQMSSVVFIIRGGRELDPISRLATPFNREVWIFVIILFLFGICAIQCLRYASGKIQQFVFGKENVSPMTNFFAVILGYPMTRLPLRNFARYLLLIFLLMSLILRNAYQGSLFDSFRMDRFSRIPEGFNDLIAWKYNIFVSKYFEDSETFLKNETITVDGGHSFRLKSLEKSRGRYATIVLKDSFMSYLEDNFRNGSKLIMIKETVYIYSSALYLAKHSIYTEPINIYLRLFINNGVSKYLNKRNAKDVNIFRKGKKGCLPLKAITIFRILGVFEIWGLLLMIATVIFVLELISVYWMKLNSCMNLIN